MAVPEFMAAREFTGVAFTVPADLRQVGSTVGLVDFTGEQLDFPTAGFLMAHTPDFMLTDCATANFTASGSIIMAYTAASSWSQRLVAWH